MEDTQETPSQDNYVSQKPDFDIAEDKKDVAWYKQNIRYYTSFYNNRTSSPVSANWIEGYRPVDKGLFYYKYLLGKQENIEFNYIATDPSFKTMQPTWQKGKKVRQLMDHLKGNLTTQLDNKEISTVSLSKEVTNKKKRMLEDLMLKYDTAAQKVFMILAQYGVQFSPEMDRNFENQEAAQRYMEYDFKETSEIIAIDIAKHIEMSNDVNTTYTDCFIDFAAWNYCGIYNYVDNAQVKQKRIPALNLIWDSVTNDRFGRDGNFAGYIERLTPEQVFSKYGDQLTSESKEEIKKLAISAESDRSILDELNDFPNLLWWSFAQREMTVTCVTMFWKGRRDTRYDLSIDKYGNPHYYKMGEKKKTKEGKYVIDDLYRGTIIGNRYLVDYGFADNVVENPLKKNEPELPIKIYTGNTLMGDGVSLIGMVHQNQDRMDLFRFKIIEMVGRDAGKSYIINPAKLGNSVTSKDLLQDFKTMGITVIPPSGEMDDPTNNKPLVETVDLTLDPNVLTYINLYAEEERVMENIMNIPKIALGQQSTYVGLGTQKGTIAQATLGLMTLYRDFVKFNEINIQFATNLAKIAYTAPDAPDAPMIVGDRGIKFLDITKDFKFNDFLVYIKIKDMIDEAGKQRLLSYAQAWSQNPSFGIDPLDILRLEKATSYTQAENELEYSLKQKKKEMQQAAAQQFEREKELQHQQLQAKSEIQAQKDIAADDRNDAQVAASTFNTLVKSESQQNPTEGMPVRK